MRARALTKASTGSTDDIAREFSRAAELYCTLGRRQHLESPKAPPKMFPPLACDGNIFA